MHDWLDFETLFAAALVGYLGVVSFRSRQRFYTARQWGAIGVRALIALAALAGGFTMVEAIDEGRTHTWPWPHRAAWASSLVALTCFGIWVLIRAVIGSEAHPRVVTLWKPLAVCLGIGGLLFALLALDQLHLVQFTRAALLVGGAALASCAWMKPGWFWHHPKAVFLRELIGDHAAATVYFVGGLVMVGFAFFGHFAGFSD